MYRCLVSLLLLPCLLLTQSAVVFVHAHGSAQPAGHALRPHFHAPAVAHDHDHTHGHSHSGHHHHDALEPDQPTAPAPDPSPADHDADAVYVAGVDAVAAERIAAGQELDSSVIWLPAADCEFGRLWSNPSHLLPNGWHPPPTGCSCPLYVRHLTLLI
jgi:hypothetical protein